MQNDVLVNAINVNACGTTANVETPSQKTNLGCRRTHQNGYAQKPYDEWKPYRHMVRFGALAISGYTPKHSSMIRIRAFVKSPCAYHPELRILARNKSVTGSAPVNDLRWVRHFLLTRKYQKLSIRSS